MFAFRIVSKTSRDCHDKTDEPANHDGDQNLSKEQNSFMLIVKSEVNIKREISLAEKRFERSSRSKMELK